MVSTNITLTTETGNKMSFGTSVMNYYADKSCLITLHEKTFIVSEKIYSTNDEVLFHHELTICLVETNDEGHIHLPIQLPISAKFTLRENPQIVIDDEMYYILHMYKFYIKSAYYKFLLDNEPELLQKIAKATLPAKELCHVEYKYFAGRLCQYILTENGSSYVLSFHYNKYGKLLRITENNGFIVYSDESKKLSEITYKDFLDRGPNYIVSLQKNGYAVEEQLGLDTSTTHIYYENKEIGVFDNTWDDYNGYMDLNARIYIKAKNRKEIKKIYDLIKAGTKESVDVRSICNEKKLHRLMKDFSAKEVLYTASTDTDYSDLYFETLVFRNQEKDTLYLPMTRKNIRMYEVGSLGKLRTYEMISKDLFSITDIEPLSRINGKRITTATVVVNRNEKTGINDLKVASISKIMEIDDRATFNYFYQCYDDMNVLISSIIKITDPMRPYYEIHKLSHNADSVFIYKTEHETYKLLCTNTAEPLEIVKDLAFFLCDEKRSESIEDFLVMAEERFLSPTYTLNMYEFDLSKWLRETDFYRKMENEKAAQFGE